MPLNEKLAGARAQWGLLTVYHKFEQVITLVLTALIAVVVVLAVWKLALKILFGIVLSSTLDPSDYAAFQAVFGMMFTVIIALEFKRSLLIVVERRYGVVHVRSVILIALLAIGRKELPDKRGNDRNVLRVAHQKHAGRGSDQREEGHDQPGTEKTQRRGVSGRPQSDVARQACLFVKGRLAPLLPRAVQRLGLCAARQARLSGLGR
jgi:uncharacterized membrane protein (DUF373 family)